MQRKIQSVSVIQNMNFVMSSQLDFTTELIHGSSTDAIGIGSFDIFDDGHGFAYRNARHAPQKSTIRQIDDDEPKAHPPNQGHGGHSVHAAHSASTDAKSDKSTIQRSTDGEILHAMHVHCGK